MGIGGWGRAMKSENLGGLQRRGSRGPWIIRSGRRDGASEWFLLSVEDLRKCVDDRAGFEAVQSPFAARSYVREQIRSRQI